MGWNTHIPGGTFKEPQSDLTDDIVKYNCHCCPTYSKAVIDCKFVPELFRRLHFSENCWRCMRRKDGLNGKAD